VTPNDPHTLKDEGRFPLAETAVLLTVLLLGAALFLGWFE
jgi:hypothetical protein